MSNTFVSIFVICVQHRHTSTLVLQDQTGAMLGLNMAVNSTIRTVAPTVGGAMMAVWGDASIGRLGVVANLAVLLLIKMLDIY